MVLKKAPVVERLERIPYFGILVSRWREAWLLLKHGVFWFLTRNPASRSRFRASPPALTGAQQEAVRRLAACGVALVSLPELGAKPENRDSLLALAETFRRGVTQLLDRWSTETGTVPFLAHNEPRLSRYLGSSGRSDDYLMKLHPEGPTLRLDDPLLLFGLDPAVLALVDSYFGLWGRLIYTDMWHTIPAPSGRRIGSQRWHRDFEDERIVKVYVYLSDIGPGAGPLQYVAGSHLGGRYRRVFPWKQTLSHYVPEGEIEKRVPESDWITCVGGAGTVVLCDTSGLHRGGPTHAGERVVATWTFVTPASLHLRRFRLEDDAGRADLSEEARFAISQQPTHGA